MNKILFAGILGFVALGDNPAAEQSLSKKGSDTINLNDLAGVDKPFKVGPHIHAATLIQKMGKEKGCEYLKKLAEEDKHGRVAILCRLLFSKKTDKEFRSPFFGMPIYLGKTTEMDWPLTPIELVDNVPFCIIEAYNQGGEDEPSLHYLKYCIENCEWSTTPFDKIDDTTIEKALQKLLASKKWKNPLSDYEKELLTSQIK